MLNIGGDDHWILDGFFCSEWKAISIVPSAINFSYANGCWTVPNGNFRQE